jgi:tetratricopeptide (TPR) repeat protein
MHAQRSGGAVRSTTEFTIGARLANAIFAYAMYLWKAVWPTNLAPLYPRPGNSLAAWQVATAAAVLIGITVLVWRSPLSRTQRVGWLWFLGTLVPVIGLVQIGEAAMADRYAYIPLIGIFFMISFGLIEWTKRIHPAWIATPAVLILAALSFATRQQIDYWQSNEELWSHTLAVTSNNFVAEDNLGGALILEGKEEQAHAHFEAAALINPKDPMSRSNLGTYNLQHGQIREAINQYQAAIDLTSDPGLLAQSYANLGAAYRMIGEIALAQDNYNHALRLNPSQFNAWLGLGLIAQKQGKTEEAITDLSRSVELQPTAQAYLSLGRTLTQAGRNVEARAAYEQALKISPDLTEARRAADALPPQP